MADINLFESYIDCRKRLNVIEASISMACEKWVNANSDKLSSVGITRVEYCCWSYHVINGECDVVEIEYYAYRGTVSVPQTIKVPISEVLSC